MGEPFSCAGGYDLVTRFKFKLLHMHASVTGLQSSCVDSASVELEWTIQKLTSYDTQTQT